MGRHKRQSGGQPGNQNARKHGYYSAKLSEKDLSEYWNLVNVQGMDPQIAILRTKVENALSSAPGHHRIIRESSIQLAKLCQENLGFDKDVSDQLKIITRGILETAVTGDVELTKRVASKFLEALESSQIE
jgi:hypothetical protein